jgi:hypothetical protein
MTCQPIPEKDSEAQRKGWDAFDPEKNCGDLNPYKAGTSQYDMFRVGWAWAEDRWLDE